VASNNWNSASRYVLFNDSTTPINGIQFVVTMDSAPIPMGSVGVGQVTAGGLGWTCGFTSGNATGNTYTCSGNLGAKTTTPGNNTPGTPTGGSDTVILDFNTGGQNANTAATVAGAVNWTTATSCTSPTPCTSGVASAANSDASNIQPTDSDSIFASDLDDSAAAATAATAAQYNTVGVGTTKSYTFFNDGPVTITGVTVGGTISGSAPRANVTVAIANGSAGPWNCTSTATTWSCTGNLTGDTGVQGNNASDGTTGNQVTLNVKVVGDGTAVATQTVTFGAVAPTCGSPTPCTNNVASPANMDASTINIPAETVTLT